MQSEEARERLSLGHYVGLQIFAIFLPPAVFKLCIRNDRPQAEDFRLNLILLSLLWIPAIVHASLFLNDMYRIGQGAQPYFFKATEIAENVDASQPSEPKSPAAALPSRLVPEILIDGPDTASVTSRENVGFETLERTSSRGTGRHSTHSSAVVTQDFASDHTIRTSFQSARSQSSVASAISSTFSHIRETRTNSRYAGHTANCALCKKCSKCAKTHIRHFEHIKNYPVPPFDATTSDHSRARHIEEQHHVERCLCRSCTGKGPPSGRPRHVDGCKCDICVRPGLSQPPKDRFAYPSGRSGMVFTTQLGMGMTEIIGGGEIL